MIQMIPDVISPEIKSTAEKNLFSEFRSYSIDEKTIILHSLGVAEHSNNIFGEIDFVIICPDGFLCVEVKGGIVERSSGNWTFTNRYGKRETKPEGPFVQAQGNMQSLRNYMIKAIFIKENIKDFIVHLVNHFGLILKLVKNIFAQIVIEKFIKLLKNVISSRQINILMNY